MFSVHQNQTFLFKVFLFTMLTVIAWNQPLPNLNREPCSRDRSRIVHNILQEKFWPLFDSNKLPVPRSCPFHPERDTLFWPEKSNSDGRTGTVESSKAAKTQATESDWLCPDCGLEFHCSDSLIRHWDETHRHESETSDSICLADYCNLFRCDYYHSKPTSANLMNYLPFSGRDCDSTRFKKLRSECTSVMQQCTGEVGLIDESLSVKLLNQLDNQICSYLTCQRYMDDLEDDSRKVPVIFFSLLGIVTVTGFTVFYYFLWTFFTRNSTENREADKSKVDNQHNLRLSFRENKPKRSNGSFFSNIFEFNRDSSTEPEPADFARKQYPINSIMEEDEDIDSPTEADFSMKSYPITTKRSSSRHRDRDYSPVQGMRRRNLGASTPADSPSGSVSDSSSVKREVCIEDLPLTTSARYVQPLKHSYSEQFGLQRLHHNPQSIFQHPHQQQPSLNYSSDDGYGKRSLLPISRSFSHSQFRQMASMQHPSRVPPGGRSMPTSASSRRMAPVRQYSLEEDRTWDQRSAHSHSSLSVRSTFSGPPRGVSSSFAGETQFSSMRYPTRHISNSALSYNSGHSRANSMPLQSAVHHNNPASQTFHSNTQVQQIPHMNPEEGDYNPEPNTLQNQDYQASYPGVSDSIHQHVQRPQDNQFDNISHIQQQHLKRQLKQQLEHISHSNKPQTKLSNLPSCPLPSSSHSHPDDLRASETLSRPSKSSHSHRSYRSVRG